MYNETGERLTETAFEAIAFSCKDLEEFSYADFRGADVVGFVREATAAALVDMIRRCSKLKKVSLTGDTLCGMKLEDLLPFGHLFHELHFQDYSNDPATGQTISNLLCRYGNLRKFDYCGGVDTKERDRLVLTALCQSCPLLEELRLVDTSLDAFDKIAGMESLRDLDLDHCHGLTDAGMAALAVLRLTNLLKWEGRGNLTEVALQSFVGANISHTLEDFYLNIDSDRLIDDELVATALASCHNLKELQVQWGEDKCTFGRNGLDGLQAMAAGCPLLYTVALYATVPALHCIAAHCSNLKTCTTSLSSDDLRDDLRTSYPAIEWHFDLGNDDDNDDGGDNGSDDGSDGSESDDDDDGSGDAGDDGSDDDGSDGDEGGVGY